jgi:hypothetical protein
VVPVDDPIMGLIKALTGGGSGPFSLNATAPFLLPERRQGEPAGTLAANIDCRL